MKVVLQTFPSFIVTFKYLVSVSKDILTIAQFTPVESSTEVTNLDENVTLLNRALIDPDKDGNLIRRGIVFTGESIGFPSEDRLKLTGLQFLALSGNYAQGSGANSGHEVWWFNFVNRVASNMFANSYLSKSPMLTESGISGVQRVLLYKPFAEDDFKSSNVLLRIKAKDETDVKLVNELARTTLEVVTNNETFVPLTKVLPTVELTSISAIPPTGITVTATCSFKGQPCPDGTELFFETSAGYLSKARVKTLNGQASTKLIPFGLESGDSIRVQCGFRLYSGIASVDGMVIDAV